MGKPTQDIQQTIALFGRCRSFGHRWDILKYDWNRKRKSGKRWVVQEKTLIEVCERCECVRTTILAVVGRQLIVTDRTYKTPNYYSLKGQGRLSQSQARFLMEEHEHPEFILRPVTE